ncbi:ephrin type-A receptor 3-like [Convolutriloba macropyga]|uniref:ephrin type-A receptor 3-like n=1 Tax=Convolutriloba macropyga TaxID=536237 RepID=UPI003F521353
MCTFTISSCDERDVTSDGECSEMLEISVFGTQYEHQTDVNDLEELYRKKEIGHNEMTEEYSISNEKKYRYIILVFNAGSSCVLVKEIQIKVQKCLSEVKDLVRYGSAYASERERYEGHCLENSVRSGSSSPLRKCSHGRWLTLTQSKCVCNMGYTVNNNKCQACGLNQYKSNQGNGVCFKCASHSSTNGETGRANCSCNLGFYRNPNSTSDPNCYRMPQKPYVYKIENGTDSVTVRWNLDRQGDERVTVEVNCLTCPGHLNAVPVKERGVATITGLQENTEYKIQIAAKNIVSQLNPEASSVEFTVRTKKSYKVRVRSCKKNYDRLIVEWNPVDLGSQFYQMSSDGQKSFEHFGYSDRFAGGSQSEYNKYQLKIRPENSAAGHEILMFPTNDTKFQVTNLNPSLQYLFSVGLSHDNEEGKSFSKEAICPPDVGVLTAKQAQAITVLVGAISIVFVALITVLFIVFCYYKKKRDEFLYSSCTGFNQGHFGVETGADLKGLSPMYSQGTNSTSKYFYGNMQHGVVANQYHMSDIYATAVTGPGGKRQSFMVGSGTYATKSGIQDMSTTPLTSTGLDLFMEASQYYDSYESMLQEYARDIPCAAISIETPSNVQNPQNQALLDLNGIFGPGLMLSRGYMVTSHHSEDKSGSGVGGGGSAEGKSESVRLVRLTEKAGDDDHKMFAMQVMTMANFTHPNVLLMHGVTFTSAPICCVIEEPDLGPLHIVLSQMTSLLLKQQGNQSHSCSTDYLQISSLQSGHDTSAVNSEKCGSTNNNTAGGGNIVTSPSSGKSSASTCSSFSNYGKIASGSQQQVEVADLLHLLRGIASGMQYLHDGGIYVHKVLCSMNVFVNRNKMCKIGGFDMRAALELQSFNAVSATTGGTLNLPVPSQKLSEMQNILAPWTALEIFEGAPFSQASDVWSFGTIIWNVFSLGHAPYFEWNRKEIVRMLMSGYRLPPPDGCPDEVYELMMACWSLQPLSRPPFSLVRQCLEKLICNSPSSPHNTSSLLDPTGTHASLFPGSMTDPQDNLPYESVAATALIDRFLFDLGMGHYQPVFDQAAISKVAEIAVLSNKQLRDLGVKSSKDRKVILAAAVSALKNCSRISSSSNSTVRHINNPLIAASSLQRVL